MTKYTIFLVIILVFIGFVVTEHVFRDDTTRICSWNIRFFGLRDNDLVSSTVYYEYVANYIKQLQPDILCLQEVSSYKSIRHLQDRLSDYNLYVSDDVMEKNKQLIDDVGIHELISRVGDRAKKMGRVQFNVFLVKKSVAVVQIHTIHPKLIRLDYIDKRTRQPFVLYNCHFPSNFSGDNSEGREKAIAKLLHDIKVHKPKNIIIAGDLNAEKHTGDLQTLDARFVDMLSSSSNDGGYDTMNPVYTHYRGGKKNRAVDAYDNYSHIDYFFVSPRVVNRVSDVYVDTTFCGENVGTLMNDLSDHCAIIMDVV